jgi:hypothetical protein
LLGGWPLIVSPWKIRYVVKHNVAGVNKETNKGYLYAKKKGKSYLKNIV